jgi:uncharacterized membrane protein
MTDNGKRGLQIGPVHGTAAIIVGVTHFVVPRIFEPFNRLGFPRRPRAFTYVNGAIETLIGVLAAIPRTRQQATALSVCYITYLTSCIVSSQVRLRWGAGDLGRRVQLRGE